MHAYILPASPEPGHVLGPNIDGRRISTMVLTTIIAVPAAPTIQYWN